MKYINSRNLLIYLAIILFVSILGIIAFRTSTLNKNLDVSVTDTVDPYACGPMDTNGDGRFTIVDFASFSKKYGSTCNLTVTTAIAEETCGFKDFDQNGKVDLADFASLASQYNEPACDKKFVELLPENIEVEIKEGDDTFYAKYNKETDVWDYTINGTRNSACYNVSVDEIATDPGRKNADISLVKELDETLTCTQVVVDYEEISGTIDVDYDAEFTFNVETIPGNTGEDTTPEEKVITLTKDSHKMVATYLPDTDKWSVEVTAQLNDGCHSAELGNSSVVGRTEVNVNLLIKIIQSNDCIKKISTITLGPEVIDAGFDANFSFNVATGTIFVDPIPTKVIIKESHSTTLRAEYKGGNQWTYVIAGQYIDSCEQGIVVVEEKDITSNGAPGVVDITLTLSDPAGGSGFVPCDDVSTPFNLKGTFAGGENVTINYSAERIKNSIGDATNPSLPLKKYFAQDGVIFSATFDDVNSKWNYSITGNLPTDCSLYSVDMSIPSDGSRADVLVEISEITVSGATCTTRVKEIDESGEFFALKDAAFTFNVLTQEEQDIINSGALYEQSGGYTVTASYQGSRKWDYTITGGRPCSQIIVDSVQVRDMAVSGLTAVFTVSVRTLNTFAACEETSLPTTSGSFDGVEGIVNILIQDANSIGFPTGGGGLNF